MKTIFKDNVGHIKIKYENVKYFYYNGQILKHGDQYFPYGRFKLVIIDNDGYINTIENLYSVDINLNLITNHLKFLVYGWVVNNMFRKFITNYDRIISKLGKDKFYNYNRQITKKLVYEKSIISNHGVKSSQREANSKIWFLEMYYSTEKIYISYESENQNGWQKSINFILGFDSLPIEKFNYHSDPRKLITYYSNINNGYIIQDTDDLPFFEYRDGNENMVRYKLSIVGHLLVIGHEITQTYRQYKFIRVNPVIDGLKLIGYYYLQSIVTNFDSINFVINNLDLIISDKVNDEETYESSLIEENQDNDEEIME